MRILRVILWVSLVSCLQLLIGQNCGGTERWAVKDGTDPFAANIDLNPANAELISIDQLLQIDAPRGPRLPSRGDNTTRLSDEGHLYRVQARLVQWKEEAGDTGDNDYHLVLTDDTLNFTKGGSRSRPTGHSFVGEIPDPQCLAGAAGEFGTQSPFLPNDPSSPLSIANSRSQLEAQFPNAATDGSWNDAGGIPVEIIGIGYFDVPHGQTGRAPNNIEIHPILSITFPSDGNEFGTTRAISGSSPRSASPSSLRAAPAPASAKPPQEQASTWQYIMIAADSADKLLSNANSLGAQGWEMISVVPDAKRPGSYVGYLKRMTKK